MVWFQCINKHAFQWKIENQGKDPVSYENLVYNKGTISN